MIDRQTIDRIMNATDIVDVVKEFVTLRKAGVNYKGLCPFHDEKTPSFVVSPAKQFCKCFSCGKGGNAVHFIMEHEQMTYPEAIKWLGKKYNIEVTEKELTDEQRQTASERESMFVLNEWARKYFEDTLHNHPDGLAIGMSYFRSRGFRDDTIRKFQLGYALPARDALATAARKKGFNEAFLQKTGLCYLTDDGRLLDRYHGRVIFPIHTVSGKVVAFGGRILGSDKKLAKYVNSPESEIYSKSHELYGIYQAKHAIVKAGCCFLVEGYTDVISMHQSGVENVVASSGTSLTEGQIRLIHRFTSNVTVLYDGDSAGIKASLRGIDMLLAEGLNVKVLLLPDGDDPDSFARKHNAAEFQAYIGEHQTDFIRFKTNLLLADCDGDPQRQAALVADVVRSLSVIPDRIVRQMYMRECASMLGVSEQLIATEVGERIKRAQDDDAKQADRDAPRQSSPTPPSASTDAGVQIPISGKYKEEELLVQAVIRHGGRPIAPQADDALSTSVATFVADDLARDGLHLRSPLFQKILDEAAECSRQASDFDALRYFLGHPDPAISRIAADLGEDRYQLSLRQRQQYTEESARLQEIVPRLLHDFKHAVVKEEMQQLLATLRDPEVLGDPRRCQQAMERYKEAAAIERLLAGALGDRVVLP